MLHTLCKLVGKPLPQPGHSASIVADAMTTFKSRRRETACLSKAIGMAVARLLLLVRRAGAVPVRGLVGTEKKRRGYIYAVFL